jgi:hypothetical protein
MTNSTTFRQFLSTGSAFLPGHITNTGSVTLKNTIISGRCAGLIDSGGHNLITDPVGCSIVLQPSDVTGDPGLGRFIDPGVPGKGYMPLLPGSQAIDAGDDTACSSSDQLALARPADGNGDGVRICDIGAVEFYPLVNDSMRLDSLTTMLFPAGAGNGKTNPVAPGGQARVDMVFTNIGSRDICNVTFQVVTLQGASGTNAVVLNPDGESAGGTGAIIRAVDVGGRSDIGAGKHQSYRFLIGLKQREPFTFLVNVLGEPALTACERGTNRD